MHNFFLLVYNHVSACFMVVMFLGVVSGSRVLVVFPVPDRSHSALGDSLVKILLNAGYEVSYVSLYPKHKATTNLTYIDVSSVLAQSTDSAELTGLPLNPSPPEVVGLGMEYTTRVLQHESVRRLLHDQAAGFDLVIAHWFHTGLLAPLAALFECPLVWYTTDDASWQALELVHEQPSPAYSVDARAGGLPPSPFTVKQRANLLWQQFYMAVRSFYSTHFVEIPAYQSAYSPAFRLRMRTLPNYQSLVHNGSLLLVNAHPPLAQAVPVPLSVKYVGGHHLALPAKPLHKKLQEFLDRAPNGVIFVSLGEVGSRELQPAVLQQLLQVFERLDQAVLWSLKGALDYVPRNVHVVERAPHLSILNHPNTVMFITEGSISSLMEATYCGVPIVGVPLQGDQFVNLDLVVARGYGRRVDQTDHFAWDLMKAVGEILENNSYRTNAKRASTTFKHRPLPAHTELLHWLQLVTSTGAVDLRSPALQLSALERLYLDVLVLLILFVWFCSKVLKVVRVHMADNVEEDKKDK